MHIFRTHDGTGLTSYTDKVQSYAKLPQLALLTYCPDGGTTATVTASLQIRYRYNKSLECATALQLTPTKPKHSPAVSWQQF